MSEPKEIDVFDLGDVPVARHARMPPKGPPPPPDGYWYLREVCHYTGWTKLQFRLLTRRRIISAAKLGSSGYYLYRIEDIKAIHKKVNVPNTIVEDLRQPKRERQEKFAYGYTAPEAHEVFRLLREGKSLGEISAMNPRIHPRLMMQMFKDYLRLEQAIILSPEAVRKINALDLDCAMPIKDEKGIVEALTSAVRDKCRSCKSSKSSYCDRCIRKRVLKSLTPRQRYGREPVPEVSDEDETELSKSAE